MSALVFHFDRQFVRRRMEEDLRSLRESAAKNAVILARMDETLETFPRGSHERCVTASSPFQRDTLGTQRDTCAREHMKIVDAIDLGEQMLAGFLVDGQEKRVVLTREDVSWLRKAREVARENLHRATLNESIIENAIKASEEIVRHENDEEGPEDGGDGDDESPKPTDPSLSGEARERGEVNGSEAAIPRADSEAPEPVGSASNPSRIPPE